MPGAIARNLASQRRASSICPSFALAAISIQWVGLQSGLDASDRSATFSASW
jgi:hypothetical protein